MRNFLLFISFIAAVSAWSCNSGGEEVAAGQNFTAAYGTYYGPAVAMQADSVVLIFEAGSFPNGNPSGEAKRLTVTCYVAPMFEDQPYLGEGEYTAAGPDGELPAFIPGTATPVAGGMLLHGTYLQAWTGAGNSTAALFTGGSIRVDYYGTEEYTITASLTDAEGNTFNTTYAGKLILSLPAIVYDETPDNLVAMYYGDGDSTRPQHWILDVFGDDDPTGGFRGIYLDIHANRVFDEGANTLQNGEYRIGSGGATGTYTPGGGEDGAHTGSYYYIMDKDQNVTGGIYITGGTFTISRDPQGIYTLTANLRGRNMYSGIEEGKTLKYTGTPMYLDMSGTQPGSAPAPYKYSMK
jgi:hypothetical protein